MCTYDFQNLSRVAQYQLTAMKTLLTALTEHTAKKRVLPERMCSHTQEIDNSRSYHSISPTLQQYDVFVRDEKSFILEEKKNETR